MTDDVGVGRYSDINRSSSVVVLGGGADAPAGIDFQADIAVSDETLVGGRGVQCAATGEHLAGGIRGDIAPLDREREVRETGLRVGDLDGFDPRHRGLGHGGQDLVDVGAGAWAEGQHGREPLLEQLLLDARVGRRLGAVRAIDVGPLVVEQLCAAQDMRREVGLLDRILVGLGLRDHAGRGELAHSRAAIGLAVAGVVELAHAILAMAQAGFDGEDGRDDLGRDAALQLEHLVDGVLQLRSSGLCARWQAAGDRGAIEQAADA